MKSFLCAVLMMFAWRTKAQACSRNLIDTLADQIQGEWSYSTGQIQAAVAASRACARNSNMMAYAAVKLAGRIRGQWSYSVANSEALAGLCRHDAVCANALVRALGRAIQGQWSYSVGMTRAIARVVELNPYWSVQCSALEAIADAMEPQWSYSRSMSAIMVDISRLDVDPAQ